MKAVRPYTVKLPYQAAPVTQRQLRELSSRLGLNTAQAIITACVAHVHRELVGPPAKAS